MLFRRKQKGLRGFLKEHPLKSAAIAAALLKVVRSRTGKIVVASAAAGAIGYLVVRRLRRTRPDTLHRIRSRTGNGASLARSFYHGKFSHLF